MPRAPPGHLFQYEYSMTTVRRTAIAVTLLALGYSARASGQTVTTQNDGQTVTTTTEGLTLRGTLSGLFEGTGATFGLGDTIGHLTALEVATTPTGTSSGGFVFKLDPSTGLPARTATTFGPSFAERALTSGEGKVSVSANFSAATYGRLGSFSFDRLKIGEGSRPASPGFPAFTTTAYTSLGTDVENARPWRHRRRHGQSGYRGFGADGEHQGRWPGLGRERSRKGEDPQRRRWFFFRGWRHRCARQIPSASLRQWRP